MATPLAIDQMTIEEKLQTMEGLWTDLCWHEEVLPVHDWQKEILDERERLIEKGESQFVDWEEAKRRINRETIASYSTQQMPSLRECLRLNKGRPPASC